jgi:AcrR family transcriptional regulator
MTGLSRKGAIRREALLESAHWSFTQLGYSAGLRVITANAGVTAMMVKSYFGTKEQMFKEVVDQIFPALAHEVLTNASNLPATMSRYRCRAAGGGIAPRDADGRNAYHAAIHG